MNIVHSDSETKISTWKNHWFSKVRCHTKTRANLRKRLSDSDSAAPVYPELAINNSVARHRFSSVGLCDWFVKARSSVQRNLSPINRSQTNPWEMKEAFFRKVSPIRVESCTIFVSETHEPAFRFQSFHIEQRSSHREIIALVLVVESSDINLNVSQEAQQGGAS